MCDVLRVFVGIAVKVVYELGSLFDPRAIALCSSLFGFERFSLRILSDPNRFFFFFVFLFLLEFFLLVQSDLHYRDFLANVGFLLF